MAGPCRSARSATSAISGASSLRVVSAAQREASRKELSKAFSSTFPAFKLCSDDQFKGKRKKYDFAAYADAKEIMDEVMVDLNRYGHTDGYSATDFVEMTDIFKDAMVKLWDICVPPGWKS